jgi:hypothetical protein
MDSMSLCSWASTPMFCRVFVIKVSNVNVTAKLSKERGRERESNAREESNRKMHRCNHKAKRDM